MPRRGQRTAPAVWQHGRAHTPDLSPCTPPSTPRRSLRLGLLPGVLAGGGGGGRGRLVTVAFRSRPRGITSARSCDSSARGCLDARSARDAATRPASALARPRPFGRTGGCAACRTRRFGPGHADAGVHRPRPRRRGRVERGAARRGGGIVPEPDGSSKTGGFQHSRRGGAASPAPCMTRCTTAGMCRFIPPPRWGRRATSTPSPGRRRRTEARPVGQARGRARRHGAGAADGATKLVHGRARTRSRTAVPAGVGRAGAYSHSIVPGGLLVMSYVTRLMPRTSLTIRVATRVRNATSNGYTSAVMPSTEVTARSAHASS